VDLAGETRSAIVSSDSESVRVLGAGLDALDLLTSEDPERLASGAPEQSLSDVRLLAPIVPPSIRDFSVFEQHIEGIVQGSDPDAQCPRDLVPVPFLLLLQPGALTGPGDDIPVPPGCGTLISSSRWRSSSAVSVET
jgi:hypothetical protein